MGEKQQTIDTCYGPVAKSIFQQAKLIRLLICDVDGVLSDGLIYQGNNGEEFKTFHAKDGYGIRCLLNTGIDVTLITGRQSKIVSDRAKTLGIDHVYQGIKNKLEPFQKIIELLKITPEQVAYIGDDLIDWPVMQQCGLAVAVKDAHPLLLTRAHYITRTSGGYGAVREICDLILMAKNLFEKAQGLSI